MRRLEYLGSNSGRVDQQLAIAKLEHSVINVLLVRIQRRCEASVPARTARISTRQIVSAGVFRGNGCANVDEHSRDRN
jgi:hypothetical protein